MQQLGKVLEWNDDRGFGFIATLDGQAPNAARKVFFHIRDYQQAGRRPETGELVKYRASQQADGKWRATQVRRASAAKPASTPRERPGTSFFRIPRPLQWLLVLAYLALLAWATLITGKLPMESWFAIGLLWVITYIAYALDKDAAQQGRWRIQENALHMLELLGGWPGALFAQQTLRHKSRKSSYRVVFWLMALLHIVALSLWIFMFA